jgi:hypothetical protein
MIERETNGRFKDGNPGGPGRPRRAIEREYLAALSDAISPDDWREVVARAVADAKKGDPVARTWLAKYVLGETPPSLAALAADEMGGRTADHGLEMQARRVQDSVSCERFRMKRDAERLARAGG